MKALFKNTVVRMSLLVLLTFFIVTFVSLRLRSNDLETKAENLRAKIDDMDEYISELQADLDRPFDSQQARTEISAVDNLLQRKRRLINLRKTILHFPA